MFNLKSLRQFFEKKAIKIDKRIRLVISVLILGLLMVISTFFNFDKSVIFIPIFIIFTYFFSYFSLLEGIKKIGWFGLFLMPVLISVLSISGKRFNKPDALIAYSAVAPSGIFRATIICCSGVP